MSSAGLKIRLKHFYYKQVIQSAVIIETPKCGEVQDTRARLENQRLLQNRVLEAVLRGRNILCKLLT